MRRLALVLVFTFAAWAASKPTALDRYVQKPDPNYKYELVNTIPGKGYTAFVLRMTSQRWRAASEVDRPIWKHWLTVFKPEKVASSTGFLFIGGGSYREEPPARRDDFYPQLATYTNSVVAELRDIPNEPLTFTEDGKPRTEDEIIAFTWAKYLKTGDENWPLRLPMTKAAVRALDTIAAFCAASPRGVTVDRFMVGGGSKRGWTTWTTAAVDKRVVGIIPAVIDLLNVIPSFEHHFRAYGFYAPAVKDYEEMGLMQVSETRRYRELMQLVDPYSYRERFTMPKYLINSAGDQFFLPDSSQFYFDDLPGEKYLRYVPNSDHSLKDTDARMSMAAFYDAVLRGAPRPKFSWKFERDGSLTVNAIDKPSEVRLWHATNAEARDFRLERIGQAYRATPLEGKAGVYTARVDKPAKGWTAFFVELTFPSGRTYPFKFTTPVRVVPDALPFPRPKGTNRLVDGTRIR